MVNKDYQKPFEVTGSHRPCWQAALNADRTRTAFLFRRNWSSNKHI